MFPGALDTSVGGHVLAGEDYLDALIRETREECGLDLLGPEASYRLVRKLSPYEAPVSALMHFYLIHSRVEPRLCEREFSGFEWEDALTLLARLQPEKEKWKDDLPVLLEVFLERQPVDFLMDAVHPAKPDRPPRDGHRRLLSHSSQDSTCESRLESSCNRPSSCGSTAASSQGSDSHLTAHDFESTACRGRHRCGTRARQPSSPVHRPV